MQPLRERIRGNGGSVYPGYSDFQLLIDIKTDGEATYRALRGVLAQYADIFTIWIWHYVRRGPITAVISGNRPRELMMAEPIRFAGYDGRLTDLEQYQRNGQIVPPYFRPLVSDNWTNNFSWTGVGDMSPGERAKLSRIVKTAHDRGYRVRFWATPDQPGAARDAVWEALLIAGVDYLNTDDLAGLRDFLENNSMLWLHSDGPSKITRPDPDSLYSRSFAV